MSGAGRFPRELVDIAGGRLGLFTGAEARSLGLRSSTLARAKRAGECARVFPGVYRVGTAAQTFRQRLLAACLWGGGDAVASHRSAAVLYGLDGFEAAGIELTVPGKPRRPGLVSRVHPGRVRDEDRRVEQGVPVTSVARTLLDLAGELEVPVLAEALDSAWRRRLVRLDFVEHRLEKLAVKGRRGVCVLRRALSDCRTRGRPLGSPLEVRTWYLIRAAGLPLPMCGMGFEPLDGQPGEIDLAYPEHSLAIECDGFAYHALTRDQFEATERRAAQLAALGWRVMRVTHRMLAQEPQNVAERIRVALAISRVCWHPMPEN